METTVGGIGSGVAPEMLGFDEEACERVQFLAAGETEERLQFGGAQAVRAGEFIEEHTVGTRLPKKRDRRAHERTLYPGGG